MQQFNFFKIPPRYHGGKYSIRKKRKTRRPLSNKEPIHLVLKSRTNLFRHRALIESQIKRQSEKAYVKVYDLAVSVDHAHLALVIPGRREYKAFIRALTGILARKLGRALWIMLPFTRVATWGRDYKDLRKYLEQNREEAAGRRPYKSRKDWYKYAKW